LKKQQICLNDFFDSVDLKQVEKIFNLLISCRGVIFFTGIGKSGIIAQKIAATFCSTGTKSLYISPTDALHGDIGIVSKSDCFVMISKSGESDELLLLAPYVRNKGALIVGFLSNVDSRLQKACNSYVYLPVKSELCPFDLSPTISTEVQLIFGDALAIAIMRKKNFTLESYAKNHPSGRIGKRITLKVKDIMLTGKDLPICKHHDKLIDILPVFSKKACGAVLIIDHKRQLQGIFVDGDLRRALQKNQADILQMQMGELMNRSPRIIDSNCLAWQAMQEMEKDPSQLITVLAVTDAKNKLVGLVKMHDIVQSGL